ncbi:MAG: hypothetical protein EBE86_018090 [Hormoscilla sp. GUM202]|nr:hypothetical protein [Hormoscilla sp. GUM202]
MTTKAPVKVEFIQFHQPALKDGEYKITVKETIEDNNKKIPDKTQFQTKEKTFHVAGERFSLNPQDIHGVFPPPGSLGEHSHVFPHVVFNRSTLPWERVIDNDDDDRNLPWMALLLFDENEKPEPKIVTLKDIKSKSNDPKFPGFNLEPGQHDDDKVTVIDVEESLLKNILPCKEDLKWLAHVRRGTDASDNLVGDEFAIVIGNRLPQQTGTSTVHLVSLEERYKNGNNGGFDYQEAGSSDKIRFVSLKSWSFACVDPKHTFTEILKGLDQNPSTLRLPNTLPATPTPEQQQIENYYKMGYLPLRHYLREGGKTVSWYRGPLSTGQDTTEIKLPVGGADQLARYNPDNGMFDESYAAAWELGRLLALQNKGFSVSLYRWKRSHAQQLKIAEDQIIHAPLHLPIKNQQSSPEIPSDISTWFRDLSLFKGVPFGYLVPDERMLPKESIRFFWVDRYWVECLLDGAFSIGRVTTSDRQRDSQLTNSPAQNTHQTVTGFLLRSEVVSGWPGLQVDGYDGSNQKLNLLRMDRLSANVLICLFEGEIADVDIHQKPETIHFGLDKNQDGSFYKKLRNREGELKDNLKIDTIPWKDQENRVVNIEQLAEDIKQELDFTEFTSAQFALEAIEGVQMVKFRKE